jgi:hypothetical protein
MYPRMSDSMRKHPKEAMKTQFYNLVAKIANSISWEVGMGG